MSIRIGVGLGATTSSSPDRLGHLIDDLEALAFDSLWLSERVTADSPDALTALAFAAGRTHNLKLGTSVTVIPGRNPMLLAKQLATLDRVSQGRLLVACGLGVANRSEQQAFDVSRDERGARFDEALPLIRRFLTEESVDHEGQFHRYEAAKVRPFPVQDPLPLWMGGVAPSELRRVGRMADGWLPSFVTPDDVKKGRAEIERVAEQEGRKLEDDHFGVLVPYVIGDLPEPVADFARRRRPGVDVSQVVPQGWEDLRALLERFISSGASKFVVVPVSEPGNWDGHIAELADVVHPLET